MNGKLAYDSDEVVILRNERIAHSGMMLGYKNTLILTNKRIIFIKKGFWGNDKEINSYPLADIKIYKEKAQALIGKTENGRPTLDIFFNYTHESFGFEWKKDIINWIKRINELTTGNVLKDQEIDNSFVSAMKSVANSLKSTINVYKEAFGISKKEEYVSCNCRGCGAPNSGIKGNTAKCPYCGTYIVF